MRVLTYNVHSCIGTDGKHSTDRIADVIASIDPDIVCLQELDLRRPKTLHADQSRLVGERLGMSFHFHPAHKREDEHFGDAILSRHPMALVRAKTFPPVPKPVPDENRGAVLAEVTVAGTTWKVLNTHFGLGREERRLQARHFTAEWIEKALPGPLVVCGDFNSRPGSTVHKVLATKVIDVYHLARVPRGRTFSTRLPLICLDYIYVSPEIAVHRVQVVRSALTAVASDHFPIVAELDAPAKLLAG
jgi:endonuclease/exonuclease/phosphatase family metal-dependent hydrolase